MNAIDRAHPVAPFDPTGAVTAALLADPLVRSVTLVGSRAGGTATALSDWDYHVGSPYPATVALRLPDLTRPLRLRPLLEERHHIHIAPGLGRAVQETLAADGLL